MKYRHTVAILQAVLECLEESGGATISQISLDANVSHSRLQDRLDRLLEAGVVREEPANRKGTTIYCLTPKGREVLLKMKEYTSSLASLGLIPVEEV